MASVVDKDHPEFVDYMLEKRACKNFTKLLIPMSDIRSLRQARGISQKDFAAQSGINPTHLRRLERGLDEITPDMAALIAPLLNSDPSSIIRGHLSVTETAIPGEGYTTRKEASKQLVLKRTKKPKSGKLNVLDLFCGAGGFSYGFESDARFQVTCGVDLLEDRVRTFHLNHPFATAIAGDLRDYPLESLRAEALSPDIIIGGPPCQGFSSLRPFRNLTEGDKRNSLPEQYLLAVGQLRPRWFVFENVVGLLSHKSGNVLPDLIEKLRGLGYAVDWRVINCAMFGVPQNRERVFVVGNRIGKNFIWPKPTHWSEHKSMAGQRANVLLAEPSLFDTELLPPVSVEEAIGDLPEVESGEAKTDYENRPPNNWYQALMRKRSATLTMHESTSHSAKMMEIIRLSGKNRYALPPGMVSSGFSSCYSRLDADQPSTTITVNFVHPSSNRCIHPTQHRALTPREGARLQSFPDTFRFWGKRPEIVKQIGNAVPPLVGRALARAIADQN